MPRGINLVVTCAKKKRRPVREALQVRTLDPEATTAARAREWVARLKSQPQEAIPAEHLYGGDHWSIVRDLAATSLFEKRNLNIWICSAGYGLFPLSSRLHPYAATFSVGQADSVAPAGSPSTAAVHADWWDQLAAWEGPKPASPRSLLALSRAYPEHFLLVVVSEVYLRAIAADLRAAVQHADHVPDRTAILCAGARDSEALGPLLLPCDARHQASVGGALTSLNVRLARELVETVPAERWSLAALRKLLLRRSQQQPTRVRYDRAPMTDTQLRRVIRKAIEADPGIRPTPLLRRLRDSGRACEHKRFMRLFHQTTGGTHGRPQ